MSMDEAGSGGKPPEEPAVTSAAIVAYGEPDKVFPILLDFSQATELETWVMKGLPDPGQVAAEIRGKDIRVVNWKGESVTLQFKE
jgi:hypothetical protein